MCPPTAGANLAYVKMMAVAFGAETDAIEEALFEIIVPSEDAQVPFDVIAERNVRIAVLGVRLGDRVYLPSSPRDLSQKVESALFRGGAGVRVDLRYLCPNRRHRVAGGCAKLSVISCHAPARWL